MKFEVEIVESNKFFVDVEADSPEEAEKIALDMFSDAPDEYFYDSDVEVSAGDPVGEEG